MHIILLDNYDSFTYNLYHLLSEFTTSITVVRNDEVGIDDITRMQPEFICLSPGPKDPAHAGVCKEVVEFFAGKTPILGVCLGMQCINEVYGGKTVHAPEPVHGKTSDVYHDGSGMYKGIPSPHKAARYHSLRVKIESGDLIPTAHTDDRIVMALRHKTLPVFGVQYHPESFLSEYGKELLANIFGMSFHG